MFDYYYLTTKNIGIKRAFYILLSIFNALLFHQDTEIASLGMIWYCNNPQNTERNMESS